MKKFVPKHENKSRVKIKSFSAIIIFIYIFWYYNMTIISDSSILFRLFINITDLPLLFFQSSNKFKLEFVTDAMAYYNYCSNYYSSSSSSEVFFLTFNKVKA